MKKSLLEENLIDIGLSENEARLYIAALSLGPTTIERIAKTADIKRTSAYYIIESLKNKGIMNIQVQGFKKKYAAEDPHKLEMLLEERRERFRKALPQFKALYNLKGTESIVRYYEGLEGMKTVYNELLQGVRPGDYWFAISDAKLWQSFESEYTNYFLKQRSKMRLSTKLLLQDNETGRWHVQFARNLNEEVKLLPNTITLESSCAIVPGKLIIHQLTPPFLTIAIENDQASNMQRQLFEIMWHAL